ncbi:glyoxalase [Eubacterium sp. AM46-8]|uniref:glyoxalase n=1 Tax=Eubacterium sp. AM46-8 TaxID=2292350 RepID=UPI000E52B1F5|nr:glyoxalase [Eubacterium sp. AM46-8]RGZ93098.1 glyoxalase [Eubacterium sp. AM46-8]
MDKHIDECAKVFLRDQKQLFDEPVAYDLQEAKEFLEDCMAVYCKDIKELREVMDDEGMDVSDLSNDELLEQLEVFKLDNGGYFFVEG